MKKILPLESKIRSKNKNLQKRIFYKNSKIRKRVLFYIYGLSLGAAMQLYSTPIKLTCCEGSWFDSY